MFVDLKTHKVIEIIKGRETREVEKVLEKYKNLKVISRDRALTYKSIKGNYTHIADRFHLIKNLIDGVIDFVKRKIPSRVNIVYESPLVQEEKSFAKEKQVNNTTLKKIELIKTVKEYYEKGYGVMELTRKFNIDKKTVRRYLISENIEETATYIRTKLHYYLDPHEALIMSLYKEHRNITKVCKLLNDKNIYAKLGTLRNFIIKRISREKSPLKNHQFIKRSDVIKRLFSWTSAPDAEEMISIVFEKYDFLNTLKAFYDEFRYCLVNLKKESFKNILDKDYENEFISKFIENLNKDYDAVLNAATYSESNGLLEGHVSKLKKIKRDMYGRASVELLRKKVIYQSNFNV